MFIPKVEERRYSYVPGHLGAWNEAKEWIQAGANSHIEATASTCSTSLPRCKVGKCSNVLLAGDPEVATVFLGDFSDVLINSTSRHSKDFVTIYGKDCCNVIVSSLLGHSDDMNTPAFTHADCDRVVVEDRYLPVYTGFYLEGDSFMARFKEDRPYGIRILTISLLSHKGDLSLYMKNRKVFTLKPGMPFYCHYSCLEYRRGMNSEEYLYKRLRKNFWEVWRNSKKNPSCKSVAA